jgi:deoxyribose-phosphate aldolase
MDRNQRLERLISLLDLTRLEATDTEETIRTLCRRALDPLQDGSGSHRVAAVCVYPVWVSMARDMVSSNGIRVASVAGAFPSGMSPLHLRCDEVRFALDEGADEIDMVINRGAFLSGREEVLFEEVSSIKQLCGHRTLKVILETGELPGAEAVHRASMLAMRAGADFIKTSTGKTPVGATPESVAAMMAAITEFERETGRPVGLKPSGGIRTADEALFYLDLIERSVPDAFASQWLSPNRLRFGASSLLDDILRRMQSNGDIHV